MGAGILGEVRKALRGRRLIWFGTRGEDGEALLQLPELEASFAVTAPLRSARLPAASNVTLEQLEGVRQDLDRHDIDRDGGAGALEFRRRFLREVSSRCAVVTYRPSHLASATAFSMIETMVLAGLFKDRQEAFEHKPWVETTLARRGIRTLGWQYVADEHQSRVERMLASGPHILRASGASGGVGVVRVDDRERIEELWPYDEGGFVGAAPFLDDSVPINLSGCIYSNGVVHLHPPSLQLIGLPPCTERPFGYCGNDFGAVALLDDSALRQLDTMANSVGAWLNSERYLGAFGIDALWKDGVVHFTEVNPRFQGSSALSAEIAAGLGVPDLFLEHLAACLGLAPTDSGVSLRDWAREQPALSHVVVHNTAPTALAWRPGANLPRSGDGVRMSQVLPTGIVARPGATLTRIVCERSVTATGFDLDPGTQQLVAGVTACFGPGENGAGAMAEPQEFWPRLQTIFACAAPVVAIGPGCHRIGYEETEEWKLVVKRAGQVWRRLETIDDGKNVEARQAFFKRFWAAQLCERRGASIESHEIEQGSPDAVRIALATLLLCALVDATSLLGKAVEAGDEPVMDWQHLVVEIAPGEKRDLAEDLANARDWLRAAVNLIEGVKLVHGNTQGASLPPVLEEYGLTREDVKAERLTLLKLEEIRSALGVLLEKGFEQGADPLSGALVEWLSDLLWHVVISGAGVPSSQRELSFFLNLPEEGYSRRRFSRSHPGEYRGPDDDGKTLDKNLKLLVKGYDSGLEEKERDWSQPREAFAWTIARSLVKAWGEEEHERFTVALVSDYDLMLERAMIEQLEEGDRLHVVTPARVRWDGQSKFKWLMGTVEVGEGSAGALAKPEWEWLDERKKVLKDRLGPVVIRLTGTPLFALSAEQHRHLLDTVGPYDITEVKPTAVFSEHDSVQAVMALAPIQQPRQQPKKGFRDQLLFEQQGLTWNYRGWLFLGHRFSDWLPRLQLLITALMLAQDSPRDVVPAVLKEGLEQKLSPFEKAPKYAVSRRFDWPERALLDALGIERADRDLAAVTKYFEREGEESVNERTARFVREMFS